jgi:hypothetical protein
MRVLTHSLTHSHFFRPGIPLHWDIEHPEAQGPLLPLTSLCHICCQCHAYSLIGGLVPGSFVGAVWPVNTVAPSMWLQDPSGPSVASPTPPLGIHILSPMVGCKHPPLHLSGSGKAYQETAVSGFHQQALPGIHR